MWKETSWGADEGENIFTENESNPWSHPVSSKEGDVVTFTPHESSSGWKRIPSWPARSHACLLGIACHVHPTCLLQHLPPPLFVVGTVPLTTL